MRDRRGSGRRRALTRVMTLAGAVAAVTGLILPWAEIPPGSYGLLKGLLSDLGAIPEAGVPVRGFEIPWRVHDESGRLGVVTALATDDLTAGRLDRVAARTLFGDRLEAKWAPLVFVPLAFAVIHLTLELRSRRRNVLIWSWLALAELATLSLFLFGAAFALGDSSGLPLRLLPGVPVTLGALTLLGAAAVRSARR